MYKSIKKQKSEGNILHMLNKGSLLLIICFFILFITNTNALTWETVCNDTSKLRYYMTFQTCESNNCTDYNITQYRNCTYGCDNSTNSCKPNIVESNAYYFLIIVAIVILVGVCAKVLKWV